MERVERFQDVARLPLPEDNAAIAVRRLEPGTCCRVDGALLRLSHTVMEGHRFVVRPLAAGDAVLSWGLPFGLALRALYPGEYLCNQGMLDALRQRPLDFALPAEPNFADRIQPYVLPPIDLPGHRMARCTDPLEFAGFTRPGGRGIGTRNYLIVLGTSARTAALARGLAGRMQAAARRCPGVDGVVAVDHTEGGGGHTPNNQELVLRTLAGFCVHPNVAAVLALDYGVEPVTNARLVAYAKRHGYPLEAVPHAFLSVDRGLAAALEAGSRIIASWLEREESTRRVRQSVAGLRIALQCGGSDAFSGISGNPLAAWVAREVLRFGGAANLAETDELIGAEAYLLQNVRDRDTATRFLSMVERFKTRMAWHGESPEGNPSAGNKYRGLYNIALKSIGAARKRDPEVRLDYCIEYGEPMQQPGFYFMDSPGNDLESIAGQVAAGCNLVFFVTGNGAVTNFPFVPTIKVVTTTSRYQLLTDDMDVNAGEYLDGVAMDRLGASMLDLACAVASGRPTCGERAGHAQVQLWRDWPQSDGSRLAALRSRPPQRPHPLVVRRETVPPCRLHALQGPGGAAFDQVGLILPTSLCSAQVAGLAAERMGDDARLTGGAVRRFVALPHTEGCGATGEELLTRALLSYLQHPAVRAAVVLEHGCEKVHNDRMRSELAARGLDVAAYGWASVQLDGGSEQVLQRIRTLFERMLEESSSPLDVEVGLESVRLGILCTGSPPAAALGALGRMVRWVCTAGGTVVLPQGLVLPGVGTPGETTPAGTLLPWGKRAPGAGVYVAEMPTDQWLEQLTGMAASGVDVVVGYADAHPLQGHPLVPVIQISAAPRVLEVCGADMDVQLGGDPDSWAGELLAALRAVLSRDRPCRAMAGTNTGLQITRGLLGVSL